MQVSWVTTQALVTLVVDLFLAGDVAVVMGEHHQMHGDSLAIQTHPAIAPTPACTRIRASPEVARAGFVIEHEPGVFDTAASFDSIKNFFSSV